MARSSPMPCGADIVVLFNAYTSLHPGLYR